MKQQTHTGSQNIALPPRHKGKAPSSRTESVIVLMEAGKVQLVS